MMVVLPAPDGPTRAGGFAGLGDKADVVQHRAGLAVAEADIAELDLATGDRQVNGVRTIGLLWLDIEDFVDHAGIDHGPLQIDLQTGQSPGRIVGQQHGCNERNQRARKDIVIDGLDGSIGQDAGDDQAGQSIGKRCGAFGQPNDAVRLVFGVGHQFVDALAQLVLHSEGLDDGDSLQSLLHHPVYATVDVDDLAGDDAQTLGDIAYRDHQRRADQERGQCQQRVAVDHHPEQGDQGERVARQRGDRQVENIANAGSVLADLRRQMGRALFAQKPDAQVHQMTVKTALVACHHIVADFAQRNGLPIGGNATQEKGQEGCSGYIPDHLSTLLGQRLVDHVAHDPRHVGGGQCDDGKTDDRDNVGAHIVAAVFRQNPSENAPDSAGIDALIVAVCHSQALVCCYPFCGSIYSSLGFAYALQRRPSVETPKRTGVRA